MADPIDQDATSPASAPLVTRPLAPQPGKPLLRRLWPPLATFLVFAFAGPLAGYLVVSVIAGLAQSPTLMEALAYIGKMIMALPVGALFAYMFGLVPAAVAGLVAILACRMLEDRRVAFALTVCAGAIATEAFSHVILHGPRGADPVANALPLIGAVSAAASWYLTRRWR